MKETDWERVGEALRALASNEGVVAEACAANPWFCREAIESACGALAAWFDTPSSLERLRAAYPAANPKRVGLILAGNLPLVGFHDVLAAWLAGHSLLVKSSRKDFPLWKSLLPLLPTSLQTKTRLVSSLDKTGLDALVATGSNNTGRYILAEYGEIPLLLRGNRWSVAVMEGGETVEELEGLAEDILLYGGLGCRSVSQILVPEGWESTGLAQALERFPKAKLPPVWEEVVSWEKAVADMTQGQAFSCASLAPLARTQLGPARVGTLHLLSYSGNPWEFIALHSGHIQCVVGKGMPVPFGKAQYPALTDWADGVDTLDFLTRI